MNFLKNDPLSLGALVATHKMDLMRACRDEFDEIDPLAFELGEVSSVYKRRGKLFARATDPECGGMALENFLPPNYFSEFDAELLIMGAGGKKPRVVVVGGVGDVLEPQDFASASAPGRVLRRGGTRGCGEQPGQQNADGATHRTAARGGRQNCGV